MGAQCERRTAHRDRIEVAGPANEDPAQNKFSYLLAFSVLFTLFVAVRWPFAWTANEENYFQLGHRLVSPGDYDTLHAVFDESKARWVGLAAFGVLTELIGFEWAHRILGLGVTIAMSAGITAVSRALRIALLPTVAAVLLFLVCRQSIVGGEWFIGSIEPKGLAYALSLLGLAAAIRCRVTLSAIMVALAAYLHFQVGLLWWLLTMVFMLAGPANRRIQIIRFAATVGILTVPLLGLIARDALAYAAFIPSPGFPSPDVIYSLIRAPHHVAPFSTVGGWAKDALSASVLALAIFGVALIGARQSKSESLSHFLVGLSAVAVLLPVTVLVSWVDRDSAWIGKFYPFRVASPLLLLALVGWAALLDDFGSSAQKRLGWGFAIAGSLIHIAVTRSALVSPSPDRRWSGVIAAVQGITRPGEAVLIDPAFDGLTSNSLPRLLERPTVVSWKFVPTAPSDLQRWYGLIRWRNKTIEQGCTDRAPLVGAMILTPETARRMLRCSRAVYFGGRVTVVDLKPH